jgi:hypothetical protein
MKLLGRLFKLEEGASQETGQMPTRAFFSFDGRAGKQPR